MDTVSAVSLVLVQISPTVVCLVRGLVQIIVINSMSGYEIIEQWRWCIRLTCFLFIATCYINSNYTVTYVYN